MDVDAVDCKGLSDWEALRRHNVTEYYDSIIDSLMEAKDYSFHGCPKLSVKAAVYIFMK